MFTKNQFEECLKNIDESLELDKENTCLINVGESFDIALYFQEATSHVITFCELGKAPQNKELKLAITKELLTANYLWRDTLGGSISILKDKGIFVYQSDFFNDNLDEFEQFLKDIADKCEYWKGRYEELIDSFTFEIFDSEDNETFVIDDENEEVSLFNQYSSTNDANNQTIILDA